MSSTISIMPESGSALRQHEFAAHIRNPEKTPCPADVEDRRMKIYRELFYNNIESFIDSGFPVLRSLLDDARWHALIREFFEYHSCRTPLFMEIPREFLHFLEHEREKKPEDLPFMYELAHYEWVELAISIAEDESLPGGLDPAGDLLAHRPFMNPLVWPLAYRYPVHRISPEFRPEKPADQPTHLMVYRAPDLSTGFLELNPVSARLAGLLIDNDTLNGRAALEQICIELGHPNPGQVIDGGLEILERWRDLGIICGTLTGEEPT